MSPGRPSASIWREKIRSKPMSLPAAVIGGRVGGERDRRDRRAVGFITDGEFSGEMLGIAGAAAIAEQHDLAAAANAGDAGREQAGEGRLQRRFRWRAPPRDARRIPT